VRAFLAWRILARNFYLVNERARKVWQIKGGVARNIGMVTLGRHCCSFSLFFFSFLSFYSGPVVAMQICSMQMLARLRRAEVTEVVARRLRTPLYFLSETRVVPVSPHTCVYIDSRVVLFM